MADVGNIDSTVTAASALGKILEDSHSLSRGDVLQVKWDPPTVRCLRVEFVAIDLSISASVIHYDYVVCRSPRYLNLIWFSGRRTLSMPATRLISMFFSSEPISPMHRRKIEG
jgi:hypothetical protein